MASRGFHGKTYSDIDISASASAAVRPCFRNEPNISFFGSAFGKNRSSTTDFDI
jgi:hypothetical protein